MTISRRNFLSLAGSGCASVVLGSQLKNLYEATANGKSIFSKGYGELISDRHKILDLPKGFQYKILSRTGEKMSDGNLVANNKDGMAAFAGSNGDIILIRNHELLANADVPVEAPDKQKYDRLCQGGTTTLVVGKDLKVKKQYVSLAGTVHNCGGGKTPWNSWISCEENVSTPSNPSGKFPVSKKHGYNFEVPSNSGLITPMPIVAMGRFRREAIVFEPKTGYIYQTEDQEDGCIYRFRPKQTKNLSAGGILETLVIQGMNKVDTSINFPLGKPKKVKWVKIEDVDPDEDTMRYEAQAKGAAIFKRGEGACYGNGYIYWTCTSGGKAGVGQIFRYNPVAETVELYTESPGKEVLDYPDNLIMAPFGDLILCEDGIGEQFLVGVTPKGELYRFARNAFNNSEFAGVCFAPDGKTMFVNIYKPGITLAIWGNWLKKA